MADTNSENENLINDDGDADVRILKSRDNIVQRDHLGGRALVVVIAIMAFLACLSIGAVAMIKRTASGWEDSISREVTIQIRPSTEIEMDNAIRSASRIALSYDGVTKVSTMDKAAIKRLLEPWLGSGLQLDELPVPQILTVALDGGGIPDFASMKLELEQSVPGASLDDHRLWVDRLTSMAGTMVLIGVSVFLLVLSATVLSVIFATRGAMTANHEVVEVLHFVGATSGYIAGQFQRHFLVLGLFGAAIGGIVAVVLFLGLGLWFGHSVATPEADQVGALFGNFGIGIGGYSVIVLVVGFIGLITALTSRFTVTRHVGELETSRIR